MSHLSNIILTGTALAPVLLTYAIMAAIECAYWPAAALVAVSAVLVVSAVALLRHFRRSIERHSFQFNSVEVADRETIGILVLYLLPLLRTSFVGLEWGCHNSRDNHIPSPRLYRLQLPLQPHPRPTRLEVLQGRHH